MWCVVKLGTLSVSLALSPSFSLSLSFSLLFHFFFFFFFFFSCSFSYSCSSLALAAVFCPRGAPFCCISTFSFGPALWWRAAAKAMATVCCSCRSIEGSRRSRRWSSAALIHQLATTVENQRSQTCLSLVVVVVCVCVSVCVWGEGRGGGGEEGGVHSQSSNFVNMSPDVITVYLGHFELVRSHFVLYAQISGFHVPNAACSEPVGAPISCNRSPCPLTIAIPSTNCGMSRTERCNSKCRLLLMSEKTHLNSGTVLR